MIVSFGIFQTHYVTGLDLPRGGIAWTGSIAIFLLFFTGIISDRLTDAGCFCLTTAVGALLVVVGTYTTSVAKELWQILLAQGVCTGLENGPLVTPLMTLLTTYFERRLPLVMGIVGVQEYDEWVGVFEYCADFVADKWACRGEGYGSRTILHICGCASVCEAEEGGEEEGALVDWTVFKELVFSLYLLGSFLISLRPSFHPSDHGLNGC